MFPHMWDRDKVPDGTEPRWSRVSWAGVVSVPLQGLLSGPRVAASPCREGTTLWCSGLARSAAQAAVSLPRGHPNPPGCSGGAGKGLLCLPFPGTEEPCAVTPHGKSRSPCAAPLRLLLASPKASSVGRAAFPHYWRQKGEINVLSNWDPLVRRDRFDLKWTGVCLSLHTSVHLSHTAACRARARFTVLWPSPAGIVSAQTGPIFTFLSPCPPKSSR